jgi:arsenite/tail-anchored protein-transporting ATPase
MPAAAFVAPAVLSASDRHSFVGGCVRARRDVAQIAFRSQPSWPSYARRITTSSRIGLPRVFGGSQTLSKTAAPVATERVVSVPTTHTPQFMSDPQAWVRAHPFRAGLYVVFLFITIRRSVLKAIEDSSETGIDKKRTATSAAISSNVPSKKATPLRHETTEEALDLVGNTARKFTMVCGKGGVGKSSMSAAVATQFADRGQVTLLVSTDPAHSLSDSFDQPVGGGDPVPVMGIENLYAQELNPQNMQKSFKVAASGGMMDELGLGDINSLFETLPPGFDEAMAISEIVKFIEGDPAYSKFERIVFDTAPTGHTLRLLALPDFLNGFLGKIMGMRSKFGGLLSPLKGLFGGGDDMEADLDSSMDDMKDIMRQMEVVRDLFRDDIQTEFIVATIPTMMAISESQRLVEELRKERIPVRHVFVNMLQPSNEDCAYCSVRHKEHQSNLNYIKSQFPGMRIATVQSFDREIRGAPALRAMGSQLFPAPMLTGVVPSVDSSAELPPAPASSAANAVKVDIIE